MGKIFLLALTLSACLFAESIHTEPCDFSVSETVASGDIQLAKSVETLFTNSCAKCHGAGASGGANVMENILDREAIVRDGMVDLADPAGSKIMKAINRPTRWMPLGAAQLPDGDKTTILSWIQAGAPNWAEAPPENDPILSHKQEASCIRWDQGKWAEKHGDYDLNYIRYLTFGHLKGQEFVMARDGAIKMVQLLSRNGGGPVPAAYVDKFGKILRINSRNYEPTFDSKAWEAYVIPGYPYAYASTVDKIFNQYVDDINRYAYSERAFVRGDFFVARVTENKIYKGIMRIPDTLKEFELKQLGIDVDKEIAYGYAKRGSVAKSGVTHQPRFVDRFDLDVYGSGSFHKTQHWITRDFNSDKGRRNIYAFPAGPASLVCYNGYDETKYYNDKVFQNDASESITGLASGFDMYAIWSGDGKNLDEADPKIAIDRSGLYDDNVVRNPLSCIMCHAGGPNLFDDDTVIDHIKGSPSFKLTEVDFFDKLFFNSTQRTKSFASHHTSFEKSMQVLGLKDPKYMTPNGEPTSNSFRKFQAWITCKDLAWELGIPVARLEAALHHSPELARELGLGSCKNGKLSRANYVHLFAKIVKDFNIGYQVVVKGTGYVDPYKPPAKCYSKFTNLSNRTVKFQVAGTEYRFDHNGSHTVQYDKDQVVSNTVFWNGRSWWTYNESWTAAACKNYAFKWNVNRVKLYQN